MEEKVEYCVICQARMNEFWNYCPNCGTKIMTVKEYEKNPTYYEKHISSSIKEPTVEIECWCGTVIEMKIGYNGCPHCGAVHVFEINGHASVQRTINERNDGIRMKAEYISHNEIDVSNWIRNFKNKWGVKND